jgi:nitrile hydratase subunit beta
MDLDVPRAHHDLGGVSRYACQPIDIGPHELTAFDKQVDAIRQLLSAKGLMNVDELRRGIEAIPEDEYHSLSYYERWLRSIVATLVRKGVITLEELRGVVT